MNVTQTGLNLHVTYDEPTITENGTPLDDLASTLTVVTDDAGVELGRHDEPASALTGGGAIEFDVLVDVPKGAKRELTVSVTALDTVGNESQPATSTILIDREAPGVPV